jgi:Domain of unknown function (DUF4345)
MRLLNVLLFFGWVGTLVLVGASGIFIARWELATVFHVDLGAMSDEARSTLINQYRFLKALEFGFGIFCVLFRREIYKDPRFNRLFLSVVLLGVGARVLSMAVDGWPHWAFIVLTILELLTFVVVALYSRQTLEHP